MSDPVAGDETFEQLALEGVDEARAGGGVRAVRLRTNAGVIHARFYPALGDAGEAGRAGAGVRAWLRAAPRTGA